MPIVSQDQKGEEKTSAAPLIEASYLPVLALSSSRSHVKHSALQRPHHRRGATASNCSSMRGGCCFSSSDPSQNSAHMWWGCAFFFFFKLSSCFCRAQSQFLTCGCLNSKTATFQKPEVRHQRSAEQKGQAAAVRQTMVRGHLHRSWSLCPQPQPAGFVLPFHKRPDQ